MDTPSCTAEPKPLMMKVKDSKHEITRSAEQSSLMTTMREKDQILDLRIFEISIRNPDKETRTTRHPINKLASTQIGTATPTQIDSTSKTDQVILGPMDPTTASRLRITSMPDQRTLILTKTKTFHGATICLHLTQSNSSMTMIQT